MARSFIEQPAEYVIMFKMDSPQCLHSGLQHEAGVCCFRRSGEGECRGAGWCMLVSLKYPCSSCTISAATPVAMALSCRHASVSVSACLRRCKFAACPTSENAHTEHTHLLPKLMPCNVQNPMHAAQHPSCSGANMSPQTHTHTHLYGSTAKYHRILFSSSASVLHPYIFNSLLPSLLLFLVTRIGNFAFP